MYRSHVLVCGGTGCTSSGSQRIRERLEKEIAANGLSEEVGVVKTGCFGLCALGPIMIVYPEGTFYSMVQEDDIPEIVSEHLLKGRVVTRLLYDETTKTDKIIPLNETNFYKKQHRVALRNCGVINPENIDEYIGTGGYEALGIVLTEKKPEDVIQILLLCLHFPGNILLIVGIRFALDPLIECLCPKGFLLLHSVFSAVFLQHPAFPHEGNALMHCSKFLQGWQIFPPG